MKYKVRGYQRRYVSEDIFEADNEQEATNLAFNSHYKGGLMLKYMENEEANLNAMQTLRDEYNCNVGYSGHERGLQITLAAVALGATSVERHITLDRSMYGSDQSSSVGMSGMSILVRDIRVV